jgi:pimeloyl-ACP methyl ester carboxylesterase
MGGAVALAFAARWPDSVHRLVLTAPAVDLPHKTVLSNALPLLAAAGRVHPRFYPTLLWDGLRAGPRTLYRTGRNLIAMDLASDMREVRAPTLLVWGRRDPLVPLQVGRMLQSAVPSSRLHVIDRAGHVVMFDRPREFNEVVLRFLAEEEDRE